VARSQERGVIFLIDEAQAARSAEPKMSTLAQLLQAIGQVQEDNLPVALVLVGLPPVQDVITEASSHAERFLGGSLTVGQLPHSDAVRALEEPASKSGLPFAPGVAERIATDCQDYPYFLQAYGDGVWNCAHDGRQPVIRMEEYEASLPVTRALLDDTFYASRYRRVTALAERLVLSAMGVTGSDVVPRSELVPRLGGTMRANMMDKTIALLIDHDVVIREGWGQLRFSAPGYGDYLHRQHPLRAELQAYRTRTRGERQAEIGR
jgi:hypothetical protein